MKVLRFIRNLLLAVLLICICAAAAFTWRGYQMYEEAVKKTPLITKVEEVRAQEDYTKLGELPRIYRDAVLAAEDHRFYEHGGVDILSIGRAVIVNIQNMSFAEGGSTITQQLAKNLYFTQEKEITRKIAEMFMAFDLESNYSKDDILELYLNHIYFGNGSYTVRSASLGYFSKEPGDMTDYECTLLAGIPNAPSVYDLNENPDLAEQRQRQVLDLMVKYEYLTSKEAGAIMS